MCTAVHPLGGIKQSEGQQTQSHTMLLSMGKKLHMDQNETLVIYGVVHVVAKDGFSRKIVGISTMPARVR